MPPVPPGRPLACCVEVPPGLDARARYGVTALLVGLGLEPRWVERSGLADGGLYYGTAPESAPPAAVALRLAPATADALAAPRPLDPPAVSVLHWWGKRWPLPFPSGGQVFEGSGPDADVVASTFAWLSGYFEAAVGPRDIHARLPAEATPTAALAAARPDLADPTLHPPVEAYRGWLAHAFAAGGVVVPGRTWKGKGWAVVPTLDVDLVRTRRLRTLVGTDPRRERLRELLGLLDGRGASSTVFLMGGATAAYDVAYPLDHPTLSPVWEGARRGRVEVGLHPSYFAHDSFPQVGREWERVSGAARREGTAASPVVRTHFLRWTEPATPRTLDGAGFRVDSSLGFASRAGFRRGTALPHPLYDLAADRPLGLWTVPLAAMDTALLVHREADRDRATEALDGVLAGARAAGGVAVLLWHNEALPPPHLDLLAHALDSAAAGGAMVDSLTGALTGWTAG